MDKKGDGGSTHRLFLLILSTSRLTATVHIIVLSKGQELIAGEFLNMATHIFICPEKKCPLLRISYLFNLVPKCISILHVPKSHSDLLCCSWLTSSYYNYTIFNDKTQILDKNSRSNLNQNWMKFNNN